MLAKLSIALDTKIKALYSVRKCFTFFDVENFRAREALDETFQSYYARVLVLRFYGFYVHVFGPLKMKSNVATKRKSGEKKIAAKTQNAQAIRNVSRNSFSAAFIVEPPNPNTLGR